jgi:hypothetical protein
VACYAPHFPICCVFWALSTCVLAKDKPELTQFGRDIRVEPGEKVGDLTCINCSIYVAGESAGEATTIHGNIIVESGGSIAGDVTAVWGDVRMQPGSQIAGDVTAVAGGVRHSTGSSIAGDVTSLEGTKWLLAIILPPIFIIGLIVALIIWLIQRSRRPARVSQPYLAAR